jgi:DNA-binding NarL/FixJ family response regulator
VIRVVLADDHALLRAGLSQILCASGDIEVVGEAADGAQALELAEQTRPDLVLMDLSMPGMDGRLATEALSLSHPEIRVIVLTSFADRDSVLDALAAGASGYVLKDIPPAELVAAVRSAARGEAPLAPKIAGEVVGAWRRGLGPDGFTDRELDVLVMLAEGLPNKLIAQHLGIAEKTVKAHLTHVFHLLGVSDRMQAALWFQRHGRSEALRGRRERLLGSEPPANG